MASLIRTSVFALLLAACIAPALAQQCTTEANNAYDSSTCTGYVTCETALCTCTNTTSRAAGCSASLAPDTPCGTVTPCVWTFIKCLDALVAVRNTTTDTCMSFGSRLYSSMLQSALGAYLGSPLQKMCSSRVCQLYAGANRTAGGARACDLGANESAVCKMPEQLTTAPATQAVNATGTTPPPAIRASLTLTGTEYFKLFGLSSAAVGTVFDSSNPAFAKIAGLVVTDLARALKILAALIRILSFKIGSLIIDFEIDASAGLTAAQTQTLITQAASNSSWISSLAAEYAKVSNETIGFGGVTASVSGQPTTAPTTAAATTVASSTTTVAATTTRAPASASPLAVAATVAAAVLAVAFSA